MTAFHGLILEDRLRIQVLSESLIRIEERGPRGFEDRRTFNVVDRSWPDVAVKSSTSATGTTLAAGHWTLHAPAGAQSAADLRVLSLDDALLFDGAQAVPSKAFLPPPSATIGAWAINDQPRIVPPPWGTLPPPAHTTQVDSGWDLGNDARDIYVFLPGSGGYEQLVRDYIKLTGPIPLPPLASLGLIDSRYYPYKQEEALGVIDTFREKEIPLDIFVLDTDWRVGASHGYGVNTKLFPDLPRFFDDAHRRNVRVMLNDHPEPASENALDLKELTYRRDGLTSLLKMGADYWWFDRNWHVTLKSPAAGLAKEVWGMRVYHDIAQDFRPDARPMIMSNVEGIDNGVLNEPSSPAAHRYPIWWTGDTRAAWEFLERGVKNAVNCGVLSLLPYVSEDLGGHHDTPDDELYVRFLQFGALSPICRLHCTYMLHRFPWMFGREAEGIVTNYLRLRYRLLPMLYTAAREACDRGLPLARRCDIYWPGHKEAASDTQYLLGADLLVAPIIESTVPLKPVPGELLRTASGTPGLAAEYFKNDRLSGDPDHRATDAQVNFGWFGKPPVPGFEPRGYSARWTGSLGPVPRNGQYRVGVRTDDGARLWLDDKLLVDEFEERGDIYKFADIRLEAGRTYALRLEYRSFGTWHTMCELLWGRHEREVATRSVWIPPGTWFDAWTGATLQGPRATTVAAPISKVPLFLRGGGMVFSIPLRQHSGKAVWPEITADCYVAPGPFSTERMVYEDDGHSVGYLKGESGRTTVAFEREGNRVTFRANAPEGRLGEPVRRTWTLRFHGLPDAPKQVQVNGVATTDWRWLERAPLLPIEALHSPLTPALEIVLTQDAGQTLQVSLL